MTKIQNAERTILHLDLDTFFVSVERLKNSKLNGKPIIVGGFSDRSVVSSCSYETRKFGVHAGMPIRMARGLCAEAIVVCGNIELYSHYSKMVTEIIADKAPLYEKASIDEHYLDISGLDHFIGCHRWAHELRLSIIKNSGLPISFGMSINKTVAKIATGQAKPNGELHIENQMVNSFLDPLSIRKIPMIGEKSFQTLTSMGIDTILCLRQMPVEVIEKVLGKNGVSVWKKANGIDLTPVRPFIEQKSLSKETTFDFDTTDTAKIENVITRMVEKLAFQIRIQNKLASCITIKIRYANFETHTLQRSISYTALDHVLIANAKDLFAKVYKHGSKIRLIGVKFSELIRGAQQLNLWENTIEMVNLYSAMDKIRKTFGSNAVQRAAGLGTH